VGSSLFFPPQLGFVLHFNPIFNSSLEIYRSTRASVCHPESTDDEVRDKSINFFGLEFAASVLGIIDDSCELSRRLLNMQERVSKILVAQRR
jgi:hypothetical protein